MNVEQTNFVTHLVITAVPDPDLELRWGRSPKKFFSPFGTQFGLKIKGWGAPRDPLLDLPLYSTIKLLINI